MITDVKLSGNGATVGYFAREGEVRTKSEATTGVGVYHPDLYSALQNLKGLVLGCCDLPSGWADEEGFKLSGLSIKYDNKDAIKSIVPKAHRRNEGRQSPLNISPPIMVGEVTEEGHKLVQAVVDEAEAFIGGKRAQGELDLEGTDGETTEDDEGFGVQEEAH